MKWESCKVIWPWFVSASTFLCTFQTNLFVTPCGGKLFFFYVFLNLNCNFDAVFLPCNHRQKPRGHWALLKCFPCPCSPAVQEVHGELKIEQTCGSQMVLPAVTFCWVLTSKVRMSNPGSNNCGNLHSNWETLAAKGFLCPTSKRVGFLQSG